MKKLSVWCAATLMAVAFVGCVKDPLSDMTNEDSRIYIVNYDSTANFSSYATFSISDSAAVIDNGHATKGSEPVDQAFIAAVKQQMQNRGYTLVSRENNPDLVVNVNRIYNTSNGLISYPDYWSYYGGYWDPYYYGYGGYGYYVPYSYAVYSVTEGALSVDILDLKNAAAKNNIGLIWTGLIRGSGIFNTNTAAAQVQQLFDQSAFLVNN